MYKQPNRQNSFLGSMIYERIIPKTHFLKQVSEVVDFSFVNDLCRDCYCAEFYIFKRSASRPCRDEDNGRAGYEPAMMFKIVFLQFLYDISDRRVEEELTFNLAFKWFIGIEADELPPDYSTLSRFRDRLGAERFKDIFNRIVEMAREKGFISDRLTIIDSTHIEAKVDLFRLKKGHKGDKGDKDYIDKGSPDMDASFGHKTKKKVFYGYKQHNAMDADSEMITTCEVTTGREPDGAQLPCLIRGQPAGATADKAYDSDENHFYLKREGIQSGIILKKNRVNEEIIKGVDVSLKLERPKIEHKFGELKKWHGLRIARYWGLGKIAIQCLISCIVVNCKRLVKLVWKEVLPFRGKVVPLKVS